jgi:V-type H+-transporting ATPase subunit E
LKLLQRREEQLQELFSIARTSILTFAEDEGRYSQFLEGAVVQGFLQLMETRVTLHVREQDADIVKMAGELAADTYTGISGREVSFELETTLSKDW